MWNPLPKGYWGFDDTLVPGSAKSVMLDELLANEQSLGNLIITQRKVLDEDANLHWTLVKVTGDGKFVKNLEGLTSKPLPYSGPLADSDEQTKSPPKEESPSFLDILSSADNTVKIVSGIAVVVVAGLIISALKK